MAADMHDASENDHNLLTVAQLRTKCKMKCLASRGRKAELVQRLAQAVD